jgi:hypothetical protein
VRLKRDNSPFFLKDHPITIMRVDRVGDLSIFVLEKRDAKGGGGGGGVQELGQHG